jgi:hypothetical protein
MPTLPGAFGQIQKKYTGATLSIYRPGEARWVTMHEINKSLDAVQREIEKINVLDNHNLEFIANNIQKEIFKLAKVYQQILKIKNFRGRDQYKEAA